MTRCDKCHQVLEVGSWPFCPHASGVSGVIPDDLPGGMVMEHVEPGRKVYSRTELKQVLANHRSEVFPRGCELSEYGWTGPNDRYFTRSEGWADFRTKDQRIEEMARFLGLTVEEYHLRFDDGVDTPPTPMR